MPFSGHSCRSARTESIADEIEALFPDRAAWDYPLQKIGNDLGFFFVF
jgi:hypothetical protein